eukprot:6760966-Prymnesium_polylepis.1
MPASFDGGGSSAVKASSPTRKSAIDSHIGRTIVPSSYLVPFRSSRHVFLHRRRWKALRICSRAVRLFVAKRSGSPRFPMAVTPAQSSAPALVPATRSKESPGEQPVCLVISFSSASEK